MQAGQGQRSRSRQAARVRGPPSAMRRGSRSPPVSQNGYGSVSFTVEANTAAVRTGTMTITGQTFTVTQAAPPPPPPPPQPPSCTYTIAPTSESIADAGGTGTAITVTAGGTCAWTAISSASWITITAGAAGTGNGSVIFIVAVNTGAARTGTIAIGGQTFTVNQAAAPPMPTCSYTLAASSASVSDVGGTGFVSVTAPAGVRVDSGDQCVMDHDHRRWDQNGHWVGELYRCGEYECGANGHDDHRPGETFTVSQAAPPPPPPPPVAQLTRLLRRASQSLLRAGQGQRSR